MSSIQQRKSQFDQEPPVYAPHEGGYYIFLNTQEKIRTDETTGEEYTYWESDAVWQKEMPE